jgi:hypothetical protein
MTETTTKRINLNDKDAAEQLRFLFMSIEAELFVIHDLAKMADTLLVFGDGDGGAEASRVTRLTQIIVEKTEALAERVMSPLED